MILGAMLIPSMSKNMSDGTKDLSSDDDNCKIYDENKKNKITLGTNISQ